VNCRYCGSTLQPGALFCVECGRPIAETAAPPQLRTPRVPAPRVAPVEPVEPAAPRVPHCPQCGLAIEADDIFCGECGFVLRPMTGVIPAPETDAAARETAVVERLEPQSEAEPTPEPELPSEPSASVAEPGPEPDPAAAAPVEDIESTRIMASRGRGERYVLQFSTGESVVVAGSGLVGRNPSPEPGEYVDELVSIFDVGKSVSKSHVEFGQESGRFWVSDRYSTNGTVVRQPDAEPVRCEPGKRYVIARGSRVEIGEQFFIVS
jgi:predicted nucleic acid-binding Zn ribbon protein